MTDGAINEGGLTTGICDTCYNNDRRESEQEKISFNRSVIGSGDSNEPHGYECPACGNYVSYEESCYGEERLCCRCENGEYTLMEPVYD